jgi:hypothetical protein
VKNPGSPSHPRLPYWVWAGLRVTLVALGFAGVFLGPAMLGYLPSVLSEPLEQPGRVLLPFLFLVLGCACLVGARALRPPLHRPAREVFGGMLGWLAFVAGSFVFGAGGGLLGVPLLIIGAWLVTRRDKAEAQLLMDEGPDGHAWLLPGLRKLARRGATVEGVVSDLAERFELDAKQRALAYTELARVQADIQGLAPRVRDGLQARSRAISKARRRFPMLDSETTAALMDKASMARER